ncbi:MAG: hypothetical protein K6V73_12720 [Firmicutes bacterium]|nr:hypothetical protein [Bacillota bacterium]
MAGRSYAYMDELAPELDRAWRLARSAEGDESAEVEMILAGAGSEALVATDRRVYLLRAAWMPWAAAPTPYRALPLARVRRVVVDEGLLVHRLRLVLDSGEEVSLRVRGIDRDKARVAGRMLAAWAEEAQGRLRAAARERRERARAEAAAAGGRAVPTRGGNAAPSPPPAMPPEGTARTARGGLTAPGDVVELLAGLWRLVEAGALRESEYQAKKDELLARL